MTEIPAGITSLPRSGAEVEVDNDIDPAVLLALAVGYQASQEVASRVAEQTAIDLWRAMRPVTDADKTEWVTAWDSLLGAQQERQAAITAGYARSTFSAFGVTFDDDLTIDVDNELWDDLDRWASSPANTISPTLTAEAEAALARVKAGQALLSDAMLADRILNLEAPVIKVRAGLAEGKVLSEAVESVTPYVASVTYNAGRAAERIMATSTSWPKFKNGSAMLYRRVPAAGACGWCILVSTRVYSLESFKRGARWHRGCRCSWRPLTEAEARAYARAFRDSKDYFKAAESIGAWEGPAPTNYEKFIAANRATDEALGL
jgi:hypothetical protein